MLIYKKVAFVSLIVVQSLVILVGAIVGGKLYLDSQKKSAPRVATKPEQPATQNPEELKAILVTVAKHLVLPQEEPKLLTVTNVEFLRREQPFFVQAENGDKLLVYAQKVILYRPSLDRVVDVAQIRIDAETSPTPAVPSSPVVVATPTPIVVTPTP